MKTLHRIKVYQPIQWIGGIPTYDLVEKASFERNWKCVVDTVATLKQDTDIRVLNYLFYHFNYYERHRMRFPILHSMSIYDIIEVNGTKYQVMPVGFKKLDY